MLPPVHGGVHAAPAAGGLPGHTLGGEPPAPPDPPVPAVAPAFPPVAPPPPVEAPPLAPLVVLVEPVAVVAELAPVVPPAPVAEPSRFPASSMPPREISRAPHAAIDPKIRDESKPLF